MRLNGQQRRESWKQRRERIRAEKEAYKAEQDKIRSEQEQAIKDGNREEARLTAKARADERKALNDARQLSDSKGGTDASAFNIDTSTGALTLNSAADYENPADSNTSLIYLGSLNAKGPGSFVTSGRTF